MTAFIFSQLATAILFGAFAWIVLVIGLLWSFSLKTKEVLQKLCLTFIIGGALFAISGAVGFLIQIVQFNQ